MAGARAIKPEEVKRVIKCIAGTRHEYRSRAMIYFAIYTACRVGEMRMITIGDCFDEDGEIKDTVRIFNTKNGEDRDLFVSKTLKKQLIEYLKHRFVNFEPDNHRERFLFESERSRGKPFSKIGIIQTVNKLLDGAGLGLTSHSLRKGALLMLRRTPSGDGHLLDFEQIRHIAGHKNLSQLMTYFKSDDYEALEGVNNLKW